ncbi:hypothetical protein BGW42_000932 [Actinomortierella wolfii]|nr:hypothetical protein BGW42_000932 [Actinomortierella wolfii]
MVDHAQYGDAMDIEQTFNDHSSMLEAQPLRMEGISHIHEREEDTIDGNSDNDNDIDDFNGSEDENNTPLILDKRSPMRLHQSTFDTRRPVHKVADNQKSAKASHDRHHHQNDLQPTSKISKHSKHSKEGRNRALGQLPFDLEGLDPSDLEDIHSIDDIKAMLSRPPALPVGLRLPNKTMNLDWLKKVIEDFHYQETRKDVLADLPRDFEKDKSIFTAIYSVYEHKDPEDPDLPTCKVPATPRRPEDTSAGLTWDCEPGHFCVAPNVSVPCIPGYFCPRNTAQPVLCCPGYYCSLDAKEIHTCPEGFYCPLASTKPVSTTAVEKYGVCGLFCGFAFLLVLIFAVKNQIEKRQKIRYRQRLIELDQRDPAEDTDEYYEIQEKNRLKAIERQHWEAVQVTRAIIEEEQKRFGGSSIMLHEAGVNTAVGGANSHLNASSSMVSPEHVAAGGEGHQGLGMLAASRGTLGGGSMQSFSLMTAGVTAVDPSGSAFLGIGGGPSTMSLAPVRTERSFDIRFEGLGLRLPTGVEIIKNVSGRLATGRTCAVMGPSGAGKTTFLSILAGKVAKTAGTIKVNGVEQTLTLWKKLIGFVPQEDVMLPELTVREILMHSARMRQPVHMSHNAKRLKVLQVIQFLGLGHIMDSRIGDVETRGISGGERKRVNIGMELVASPSILFLDEPTSGLDSATSLEVCKLLKQIAREQSLTVAAVVHSPSPHAFQQFDDLLLLGAGGRVVYFGPREEASAYFESIGFPTPEDESPADFYIRLAAGRVDRTFTPLLETEKQEMNDVSGGCDYDRNAYGADEIYNDPYHPRSGHHNFSIHGQHHHHEDQYRDEDFNRQQEQNQQQKKKRRANTPDERIKELFAEWEKHCLRREHAKNIEKHAIRESETMMTVQLSNDEFTQPVPSPPTTLGAQIAHKQVGAAVSTETMHVSPQPLPQNQLIHQQHALEQQARFSATNTNPGDSLSRYIGDDPLARDSVGSISASRQLLPQPILSQHQRQEFDEKAWDLGPSDPHRGSHDHLTYGQTPIRSVRVERDVSNIAVHQLSRPPSPVFSVAISNLAGSSELGDSEHRRLTSGHSVASSSSKPPLNKVDHHPSQHRYFSSSSAPASPHSLSSSQRPPVSAIRRAFRRLRISIITNYADTMAWLEDVWQELMHWMWTIKCWFTGDKDPVRETPSIGMVFLLCFKRACMQIYRSPGEFLSDQSLHLACGLCVSFAVREMTYIPRQPAEICALAPVSIQLQCATPINDIPYVGMFMCLGLFFAGISVGITTFGHEKAVFWRDTSAGMATLPYYLAKVLADIPRVLVAGKPKSTIENVLQPLSSLLLIITLLYINAFAIGYCVSTFVSRSMFALVGTGMALAWALVFSGIAPHLYKVVNSPGFRNVQWLWAISGPRWGVEAFYLKEMKSRDYNELTHNRLDDTYSFEDYDATIWNMIYISLGWHVLTLILIKLLDRHKAK